MSHIGPAPHQHQQVFAVPSRTLKEMLQDERWGPQRPAVGYYNQSRPEQPSPSPHWNTAGKVYELRSGFKHCARSGTPHPQWNAQHGTYQQTVPKVTHGQGASIRKRRHSTASTRDEPFVDLTNDTQGGAGRQPKRHKGGNRPACFTPAPFIAPPPPKQLPHLQRAKGPAPPVRIESIFRHVELLAQSYWNTGIGASRW